MKKKFSLGLGIFFLASAVIGLGSATYYHVDSPYLYYNVEPQNQPPATRLSQLPATEYSRPVYRLTGPLDVRHKYIVPRIEREETSPVPLRRNFMENPINGRITKNRLGEEMIFSVDTSSFGNDQRVQWKWHYNSHAVHCHENPTGDLICKEVNPHIPAEIWAEFFVPQAYEKTYPSNRINLHPFVDVMETERPVIEVNEFDSISKKMPAIENMEMRINVQEENYYLDLSGPCYEYDPYDNRCDL